MNVTPEDCAAGFNEIRVAMLSGKLEVVRVSAPTGERLGELMRQKMSQKVIYDFIGSVTGKDLKFILEMSPEGFHEIFLTACSLIGADDLIRNAMRKVGEKLIKDAEAEQE